MPSPARALLLPLCLAGTWAASAPDAWGWTPPMDDRVAREAVRLMPASLKGILAQHEEALIAGVREAAAEEPPAAHSMDPGQKGTSAAGQIEDLVARAVHAIDNHRPFPEVARLLGRIAHYAGDLNNPLQVDSRDPREDRYAAQYTAYVERNLPKYPLVFYGWDDGALDAASTSRQGVRGFAERAARDARRDYGPIRSAYDPANPVPREKRFDDRSLPFGIGALAWSRTVTHTARLWRHVWRMAHGDLGGTPYVEAKPAARAAAPPGGRLEAGPPAAGTGTSPPAGAAGDHAGQASGPRSSAGSAPPAAAAGEKPPIVKVIRPKRKPKPPEPDPNAPAGDANSPTSEGSPK